MIVRYLYGWYCFFRHLRMARAKKHEEVYPCARCGTGVITHWSERGMLSDPNTTLVADWVFHSSCWDGMVLENPPFGDGEHLNKGEDQ